MKIIQVLSLLLFIKTLPTGQTPNRKYRHTPSNSNDKDEINRLPFDVQSQIFQNICDITDYFSFNPDFITPIAQVNKHFHSHMYNAIRKNLDICIASLLEKYSISPVALASRITLDRSLTQYEWTQLVIRLNGDREKCAQMVMISARLLNFSFYKIVDEKCELDDNMKRYALVTAYLSSSDDGDLATRKNFVWSWIRYSNHNKGNSILQYIKDIMALSRLYLDNSPSIINNELLINGNGLDNLVEYLWNCHDFWDCDQILVKYFDNAFVKLHHFRFQDEEMPDILFNPQIARKQWSNGVFIKVESVLAKVLKEPFSRDYLFPLVAIPSLIQSGAMMYDRNELNESVSIFLGNLETVLSDGRLLEQNVLAVLNVNLYLLSFLNPVIDKDIVSNEKISRLIVHLKNHGNDGNYSTRKIEKMMV